MHNNQQLHGEPQLNRQIVGQLTHMRQDCHNPFIEQYKTASERLREEAAADTTIDPVTTMDRRSLLACLVAGRNTCTKNILTTSEIGGVVFDTVYSSNVQDIVLRLQAPANGEHNPGGLQ
jgi:hypothetical protein